MITLIGFRCKRSNALSREVLMFRFLLRNFGITSVIHKKAAKWNLYIPQSQMNFARSILQRFIIPSMDYKIVPRNDLGWKIPRLMC